MTWYHNIITSQANTLIISHLLLSMTTENPNTSKKPESSSTSLLLKRLSLNFPLKEIASLSGIVNSTAKKYQFHVLLTSYTVPKNSLTPHTSRLIGVYNSTPWRNTLLLKVKRILVPVQALYFIATWKIFMQVK